MLFAWFAAITIGLPFISDKVQNVIWENNRAAITQFYMQQGIVSKKELTNYLFASPRHFFSDIAIVEHRLQRLEPDAPLITDICVLPHEDYCWRQYLLSNRYRAWLVKKLPFAHPIELDALLDNIADTEWRTKVWLCMYHCKAETPCETGVKLGLQQLRELIGRVSYDNQEWPSPLPLSGHTELWDK